MSKIVDLSKLPKGKEFEEMTTEEIQEFVAEISLISKEMVDSIANSITELNKRLLESINPID